MNRRFYFIVIEGLDGSGKTTISQRLGDKLRCETYHTPAYPFDQIRTAIDKIANPAARFFFYLSSVLHASEEIRQLLKKTHVVCDRYIYSTVCYHNTLDPRVAEFDLTPINLLKPDFVFYLQVSHEERLRRIAQRENMEHGHICNQRHHKKDFLSMVEKEFYKSKEMIVIDAENKDVEEILLQIYQIIMPTGIL